jgi:hypothetical protein
MWPSPQVEGRIMPRVSLPKGTAPGFDVAWQPTTMTFVDKETGEVRAITDQAVVAAAGRRLTCAAACDVKISLLFARNNPHRGRILALSRAFGFFDVEGVQRGPWLAPRLTFGSMSIARRTARSSFTMHASSGLKVSCRSEGDSLYRSGRSPH